MRGQVACLLSGLLGACTLSPLPVEPELRRYGTGSPLIVLLHDAGSDGISTASYLGLSEKAAGAQFSYALPLGQPLRDMYCWDVVDGACSDLARDDAQYVVDQTRALIRKYGLDCRRAYLVGIGSGGVLAYRIARRFSGVFAAVATFGAIDLDAASSDPPTQASSILHVHSRNDQGKPYLGGKVNEVPLPSVEDCLNRWASFGGCASSGPLQPPIDLDARVSGAETDRTVWTGCKPGVSIELWSSNLPASLYQFQPGAFGSMVWTWLEAKALEGCL